MPPFEYNIDVPIAFAKAVFRIINDIASWRDWETIDQYTIQQALDWYSSILKSNKMTGEDEEIAWFKQELKKKETSNG
jgi:hypothetical protein